MLVAMSSSLITTTSTTTTTHVTRPPSYTHVPASKNADDIVMRGLNSDTDTVPVANTRVIDLSRRTLHSVPPAMQTLHSVQELFLYVLVILDVNQMTFKGCKSAC